MKIKICGITRIEDAVQAEKLCAWAIGYIFVPLSKRYISPKDAREISIQLSENIEKIGVFVNSSPESIKKTAAVAKLTCIQLHGDETPAFCKKIKKQTSIKVIKALRIKDEKDLKVIKDYKNIVSAILLDTYSAEEYGGTGKTFDWGIAVKAKEFGIPIILAGGINPENIKEAKNSVEPFAFDVSSGVEAEKGIKDFDKMARLFNSL